jgi:hypothetical protein
MSLYLTPALFENAGVNKTRSIWRQRNLAAVKTPRRPRGEYRPRVIVKFREHIQLQYGQRAAAEFERRGIGPWQRPAAEFKGISIEPLFPSKKRSDIGGLVRRAVAVDPTYRPPDGAVAILEVSLDWAQLLQVRPMQVKGAKQRRVVYAPVNRCGHTSLPEASFPAKSRIPMRLLVNVPREWRKHEFEIFARQCLRGRGSR